MLNSATTTRSLNASPFAWLLITQFVKYLCVGGMAFLVDFGVLVALTEGLGWHYLVSATMGFLAGLITNYLLSISWVFSQRTLADWKIEFAVFAGVGLVGLALTGGLLFVGADLLGIDYRLCKLATVVIVTFWNFGVRRILLFKGR